MGLKYQDITQDIIGAAFEVHNILGYGFLEKVYQRALQVELVQRGHTVELEPTVDVKYKGVIVGNYAVDLLVDDWKMLFSEIRFVHPPLPPFKGGITRKSPFEDEDALLAQGI
ncbi:MAG: GxxExxY protein [Calditrichaeota bacterium]|nr:GxxExxY protein [Calditrichota bacterium]